MIKVGILGANSQIAKDLLLSLKNYPFEFNLFCRRPEELKHWAQQNGLTAYSIWPYEELVLVRGMEVLLNFVGSGDPSQTKKLGAEIVQISEYYDMLAIDYIKKFGSKYVFVSSGAALMYDFEMEATENTESKFNINRIGAGEWYGVAKMMAECRHRSLTTHNICDFRVYSYFSSTQNPKAKFFMSEALDCIENSKTLLTSSTNINRDYITPPDVAGLLLKIINQTKFNFAVDCYTKKPASKFELLKMLEEKFGLKYEINPEQGNYVATGLKPNYFSQNKIAEGIGYLPRETTLSGVAKEMEMALNARNKSLTFSMISFNDETLIEECLRSIRDQDYDQQLIDILLVDGGSTDGTVEIAKKYGAKVISRPDLRDTPSSRGGIALTTPKTDFIVFFSADNRLMQKDTISLMVSSFNDEKILGCETMYYGSDPNDPIVSRYFSLIGGADPVAVALGKADRSPRDNKSWYLKAYAKEYANYFLADFANAKDKIPTLGANGFMLRTELLKYTTVVDNAAHIDMCLEIIEAGFTKTAFIKSRYVNHFINVGIKQFVLRRLRYAEQYSGEKIQRVYSVYRPDDFFRLCTIILGALTLILPTLRAIRGYLHVRDVAWFLHPLMLLLFIFSYGIHYSKLFISRKLKIG